MSKIIYASVPMKRVMEAVEKAAGVDSPVLITGESGTGKELVARAIHDNSERKNKPFIAVNVSSLTGSIFSSEMFGHKKGSFTGADKDRQGLIMAADEGTLFLDEIGDLPLEIQINLLRVMDNKEIISVGSDSPKSFNVRMIAASNCDFREKINRGEFRKDLFYRLNIFPIFIPPLRDRKDDILILANYFIGRKSKEFRIDPSPKLSEEAENLLLNYPWLGNVRELQSVVERSLIYLDKNINLLKKEHLSLGRDGHFCPVPISSSRDLLSRANSLIENTFQKLRQGEKIDIGEVTSNFRSLLIMEAQQDVFPDLEKAPEMVGLTATELIAEISRLVFKSSIVTETKKRIRRKSTSAKNVPESNLAVSPGNGGDSGGIFPAQSVGIADGDKVKKNVLNVEDFKSEKDMVIAALRAGGGIQTRAAEWLGKGRKAQPWVSAKIKQYGLQDLVDEILEIPPTEQ